MRHGHSLLPCKEPPHKTTKRGRQNPENPTNLGPKSPKSRNRSPHFWSNFSLWSKSEQKHLSNSKTTGSECVRWATRSEPVVKETALTPQGKFKSVFLKKRRNAKSILPYPKGLGGDPRPGQQGPYQSWKRCHGSSKTIKVEYDITQYELRMLCFSLLLSGRTISNRCGLVVAANQEIPAIEA